MRDLVNEGSLWQTLDTSSFYSRIPPRQLLQLLKRAAQFVQVLNLRGCSQLVDTTALSLKNLVSVTFEGCRWLTSDSLIRLLSQNPRLRHLDINALNAVNDDVLLTISVFCVCIEKINISNCRSVSESGVHNLVQGLRQVQDLRLSQCRISRRTMMDLNKSEYLTRLSLAGCTDLKDIWLKDLLYGERDYGVIVPEIRFKSKLVHLDVSRCHQLTSNFLKYCRWVLSDLEKLELAGLTLITDQGLTEVLLTLPDLTHIDLEDCKITDRTLLAMSACKKLRHIQLSFCNEITDTGVLALIKHLPLSYLDIDNTSISDVVLSAISALPQRMRISIYDCPHLSWTGILSILTSNSDRPDGLKWLKTFYGWQVPVEKHTKRCVAHDIAGAKAIEKEWARHMIASSEDAMRDREGRTRFLDSNEQELRADGREGRNRARSCLLM